MGEMICSNGKHRSRLQRRAPAALQISPVVTSTWNVAIPLLSPLAGSPPPALVRQGQNCHEKMELVIDNNNNNNNIPVVFKMWQHPATAPFCYESTSAPPPALMFSFLPV
ncbi:hypothetical protein ACFE04_015775 [Oxalis oulophora]